YKVDQIKKLAQNGSDEDSDDEVENGRVSVYQHNGFVDLCKGPHVERTGKIGPFKLLSIAGAYWRGNERNPQLQRIYGTVWPDQKQLDDYLKRLQEIERRDHRVLGKELELLRIGELGTVYRYERGGTLHGMLRVRGFTQDDSHIFCSWEQAQDEIGKVFDLALEFLSVFGYTEPSIYLSTRPEKRLGSDELWD